MKAGMIVLLGALTARAFAGDIVLQKTNGDVSIRHGVEEAWSAAAAGDVLKPDDTIKTGRKATAVLVATLERGGKAGRKSISLPPEVIVDLSDIRDLTQEELMLKLTMEKVRASSYQWKSNEMHMSPTTAVHGDDRSPGETLREVDPATGTMLFNGVRVLFNNGFYATCALKGIQVLRRYPVLDDQFAYRMLVAESLERADLRGEAISEYGAIADLAGLTAEQQETVRTKIEMLRKP
jgi:hypothetical protein